MAKIHRLSPYNIEDDIVRTQLYREVRQGGEDWIEHEIALDEVLMPELISQRVYGTDELKWVVLVASEMDDMREALTAGNILRLPTPVWVRQRIRYWMREEEKITQGIVA